MLSLKSELVESSDGERRSCLVKRLKKLSIAPDRALRSDFFSFVA